MGIRDREFVATEELNVRNQVCARACGNGGVSVGPGGIGTAMDRAGEVIIGDTRCTDIDEACRGFVAIHRLRGDGRAALGHADDTAAARDRGDARIAGGPTDFFVGGIAWRNRRGEDEFVTNDEELALAV